MGSSTPDTPAPAAKKPERIVEVEAEDIELGTSALTAGTDLRTKGKRSLTKPAGGVATSGLKI